MADLATGITTAFTTWVKRSGTAGQIVSAGDLAAAASLASATVIAYLGTVADTDVDNELGVAIGFMEALLWLSMNASLKVSAADKEWIIEMKARRDMLIKQRKQAEWLIHQKTRARPESSFTDTDLYPFS